MAAMVPISTLVASHVIREVRTAVIWIAILRRRAGSTLLDGIHLLQEEAEYTVRLLCLRSHPLRCMRIMTIIPIQSILVPMAAVGPWGANPVRTDQHIRFRVLVSVDPDIVSPAGLQAPEAAYSMEIAQMYRILRLPMAEV